MRAKLINLKELIIFNKDKAYTFNELINMGLEFKTTYGDAHVFTDNGNFRYFFTKKDSGYKYEYYINMGV